MISDHLGQVSVAGFQGGLVKKFGGCAQRVAAGKGKHCPHNSFAFGLCIHTCIIAQRQTIAKFGPALSRLKALLTRGGYHKSMKRTLSRRAALSALLALAALPAAAQVAPVTAQSIHDGKRPRLVIVISIDQFRADYIRRLTDLYLPADAGKGRVGGFRYLMQSGADFLDARYQHVPLFTGPGHAVILSGGYPYKTGIVANDWWDRDAKAQVYCVDDPTVKVVGALPTSRATPMGPRNMHSSTVGDELKLATAGRAKVVTLSLKDRAAILLGGHLQDTSIWFDTEGGRWISSTAYCRGGQLPAWVEAVNAENIPAKALGTTWTASVDDHTLQTRAIVPALQPGANPSGLGRTFPHKIGAEPVAKNFAAWTLTPGANAYVFETARRAVAAERLGQRDENVPDLLAFNLATNDYAGHAFGPYSPEALDISVQTDRQLSDFLNYLNETVPGGLKNVVVVVTADHGVAPLPEDSIRLNLLPSERGRTDPAAIAPAIQAALAARFGDAPYIATGADGKKSGGYVEGFVYLNPETVASAVKSGRAQSRAQIEMVAKEAVEAVRIPGLYAVYTRSEILGGGLAPNDLTRHLANGWHPRLSGRPDNLR